MAQQTANTMKAEQLMTVRAAVEIERAGMVGSDEYVQVWEGVLGAFGLPGFTDPMSLDQEATLERLVETVERLAGE